MEEAIKWLDSRKLPPFYQSYGSGLGAGFAGDFDLDQQSWSDFPSMSYKTISLLQNCVTVILATATFTCF